MTQPDPPPAPPRSVRARAAQATERWDGLDDYYEAEGPDAIKGPADAVPSTAGDDFGADWDADNPFRPSPNARRSSIFQAPPDSFGRQNNPAATRFDALSPEDQQFVRDYMEGTIPETPENDAKVDRVMYSDHPIGPRGSIPGEPGFFPDPTVPAPTLGQRAVSGVVGPAFDGANVLNMIRQSKEAVDAAPHAAQGPMTVGGIFAPAAGAIMSGSAATGIPLAGVGGIGMAGALPLMGLSTMFGAAGGQEPHVDYTQPGGGGAPNLVATDADGNPLRPAGDKPEADYTHGGPPPNFVTTDADGNPLPFNNPAPKGVEDMMLGRGPSDAPPPSWSTPPARTAPTVGPNPNNFAPWDNTPLPGASSENDPNGRNTAGIGTSTPSAFGPGRFPGRADTAATPHRFAGPTPDNNLAPYDYPPDGAGGGIHSGNRSGQPLVPPPAAQTPPPAQTPPAPHKKPDDPGNPSGYGRAPSGKTWVPGVGDLPNSDPRAQRQQQWTSGLDAKHGPAAHPSGYGSRWVPMIQHADGTTTELKLRMVSSNTKETHWEVENGPKPRAGDKAITRHISSPPPKPKPPPKKI